MNEKLLSEKSYTVEEYFDMLQESEVKLSYFGGKIQAMAGGTPNHARVIGNTFSALKVALRDRDCTVFTSDLGVFIEENGKYTFPDLSVICGEEDYERELFLKNPGIIIEVTSKSTEDYDRDAKMLQYFSILSLREYVIIKSDKPVVIVHSRTKDNDFKISGVIGIDSKVELENFNVSLSMRDLYRKVTGLEEIN